MDMTNTHDIRRAVTGKSTSGRIESDGAYIPFVKAGALVHLTDNTRYSRTGRNLKALCGASVTPDWPVGIESADARICPKCEELR